MATSTAALTTPVRPAVAAFNSEPDILVPGKRKAAIFVTTLGDEAAAILRQLTEEQVHDLTREISTLGKLTSAERNTVLNEFLATAGNPNATASGGVEYATSVLLAAFGPETGKRMAERLMRSVGSDSSNIDNLRRADAQQLAKVVQREHPQTLALILCNLDTTKAARVLSELPDKLRAQVARRMAALDQVSPEVTNRLAKIIGSKLRVVGESSLESFGGVRTVAELLNRVDPTTSEEILKEITADDPALGHEIRQIMFVFEDLLNINQDSLRKLLGKVDRKVLTLALKGSSPQIKKHFASAMSQRASEMLSEDMQALGPVRIRDVQHAQQALIATARQMNEAGEISLQGGMEEFVE
ncbi:MAG: flagellar motor switch protein FliG [Acidobacteriia bacterium]|nr:flagellar motor switch protein FliG [Terriglobia bacterium]